MIMEEKLPAGILKDDCWNTVAKSQLYLLSVENQRRYAKLAEIIYKY